MGRAVAGGLEGAFLAGLIAAQHQQVAYSEELQIDEHVLQVLPAVAAAHHMGHHRQPEALLYGGRNGDGAGTPAHTLALHQSTLQIVIDILTAVACDVDIEGVKFLQLLDGTEQIGHTRALQRRQHLEGECRALMAVYLLCYAHLADKCMRGEGSQGHRTPNWV